MREVLTRLRRCYKLTIRSAINAASRPGLNCHTLALTLIAVCAWGGALAPSAAVDRERHPSGSTQAYIQRLEDPSRAEWQKPERVVQQLNLRPGQGVADLGAGSGYFAVRLARAVGEMGKVYAVDVDPEMVDYLRRRVKKERPGNIEAILALPDDPRLDDDSVDLVFVCNTLHHIENRERYYPLIARALRPGGRLVVIDFYKRPLPVGPPPEMKISRSAMIQELEAARFELVEEFDFLPYQYFLVFQQK